jgi:hypothetical protein
MRRTSQGQLDVGTTFQQRDRFMGRRMDLSLEVTDYEPPHKIGLKTISGQLSFGGTRMFEPVGEAATRVTFVGEGHAPGVLKLAEPLLAAAGERRLRAQLGNLKRLLEAQVQGYGDEAVDDCDRPPLWDCLGHVWGMFGRTIAVTYGLLRTVESRR